MRAQLQAERIERTNHEPIRTRESEGKEELVHVSSGHRAPPFSNDQFEGAIRRETTAELVASGVMSYREAKTHEVADRAKTLRQSGLGRTQACEYAHFLSYTDEERASLMTMVSNARNSGTTFTVRHWLWGSSPIDATQTLLRAASLKPVTATSAGESVAFSSIPELVEILKERSKRLDERKETAQRIATDNQRLFSILAPLHATFSSPAAPGVWPEALTDTKGLQRLREGYPVILKMQARPDNDLVVSSIDELKAKLNALG